MRAALTQDGTLPTAGAAIRELLDERGSTHGDAEVAAITYARLRVAAGSLPDEEEHICLRYPFDMILVKLARIACGDPTFEDHWKDIAGYAELARRMVTR